MARFKNGVSYYTRAEATVRIGFPEGQTSCKWCDFCRLEVMQLERYRCMLTHHVVYDPFAPTLPDDCPFEILNDFENNNKKMEVETDDIDS